MCKELHTQLLGIKFGKMFLKGILKLHQNLKSVHILCCLSLLLGIYYRQSVFLCIANPFENLIKVMTPLLEKCKCTVKFAFNSLVMWWMTNSSKIALPSITILICVTFIKDFSCWLRHKEFTQETRVWFLGQEDTLEKIPWSGYPLQYSFLENPMDREAWWATVHGITKESDRT